MSDNHRRVAPFSDFAGNPIHEGDTIRHPDGDEATAVYGGTRPNGDPYEGYSCWRAVYADGTNLYLWRQVAGRGEAVVVPAAAPNIQSEPGCNPHRSTPD